MSANGLHRIRWRRVAVARIHRTAASQFARDLVNIQQSIVEEAMGNVGKRTPSDHYCKILAFILRFEESSRLLITPKRSFQ